MKNAFITPNIDLVMNLFSNFHPLDDKPTAYPCSKP